MDKTFLKSVREFYAKYGAWIKKNPDKASEYETLFKWVSYFVAGRIDSSLIPTETAYALSNLLVFHNDRLIQAPILNKGPARKVKEWLTVLEYLEVLLEVSAKGLRGPRMGWIVVGIVQVLKTTLRLLLIFKYKESVICSPAIPTVSRTSSSSSSDINPIISFKLKRSGRVIRKVEASPSNGERLWVPPPSVPELDEDEEGEDLKFELQYILGEVVHSVRPLAHLLATYRYGPRSWKPWMLSLFLDAYSYSCLKLRRKYANKDEEAEVSARVLRFLLYFLRSPFYENLSKNRIDNVLDVVANNVLLFGGLARSLKEYIPRFQSTYSYTWST